jgi:hypothetical protein
MSSNAIDTPIPHHSAKADHDAEHAMLREIHSGPTQKNKFTTDSIPKLPITIDTASKYLNTMCFSNEQGQDNTQLNKLAATNFALPKLDSTDLTSTVFNPANYDSANFDPTGKLRVGMAWNGATNLLELTNDSIARHDIVIGGPGTYKLKANNEYPGLATSFTPESVEQGDKMHSELKEKNPDILTLAEVRYRDADSSYLPTACKWWQSDNGKPVDGYPGAGLNYRMLDIKNPQFQDHVADQAAGLIKTGAVDGVMLDWFNDGVHSGKDWDKARLDMLTKIRKKIDEVNPQAKIFINTNAEVQNESVSKLVDGYYMECTKSSTKADWDKITKAVDSAEKQGKTVFVETWIDNKDGRKEENKMRATMALVMTHAPDGVALFGDRDNLKKQEHQHDFYNFYETKIGKSIGPLQEVGGTSQREFENGTFVYNPMGNGPYEVHFPTPRTSAATGKSGTSFWVADEDGDFFSK